MKKENICGIIEYATPSTLTDWIPNFFVDISKCKDSKLNKLKLFVSQKNKSFLMGHTGNEKLFDEGVLYEGVNEKHVQYRGETGAQDDIIPTLDIFTGITNYYPNNMLTKYLFELRDYRPKVIIEFFNDLEKESNNLTLKILELCGAKGLIYFLVIINEIYLFRIGHWNFVKKYIMSNTKYNVATGGTPLNLWLPNQIKACLN